MPSVAILLCTFNGTRFLAAQLASYTHQSFKDWRLFASDDGSTDDTLTILSRYRDGSGPAQVAIREGPRQGFVRNFLALACDRAITGDYYAYSDQDDIWEPDKLSRAIAWLETCPPERPALYCGRTGLVDEDGHACGLSPLFQRKPSFRNALVQSIAGGNTMVFNDAARQLLLAGGGMVQVPLHDWWTYLVTTAAGGEVRYDPTPSIRYRIHPRNLIGANEGWRERARRLRLMAHGRFETWTNLHIAALEPLRPRMTAENRAVFDLFRGARRRGVLARAAGFRKTGVYRQTGFGNLGLILAILAGKI